MLIRRTLLVFVMLLVVAPAWAEDFGEIRCVQFAPNGRLAAFASYHSVRLWDTATKRKVGELKGHTDDITALTIAPDGKTLFTASRDKTVRQWDLLKAKELRTFEGHTAAVECIAVSPDGKTLATAGRDQVVRVWDVDSGKERCQFTGHKCTVDFVTFSPNGKTVASGGEENSVRLWNVETGRAIREFPGRGAVCAAAFTPDGKRLIASNGVGHVVRMIDVESGEVVREFAGHDAPVMCVALSPDGLTLATGGRDSTLRLWDLSGRQLKKIECHSPGVISVAFSPDGHSLISGGYDCNVNLWEMATGKLRLEYKPDTSPAAKPPEALTPERLETLLKTLESDEAAEAYDAVLILTARPQEAVPFLQKQLKAANVKIDAKQIQKWIKELDDEDFTTRENAQMELQKLGRSVIVPVQTALGNTKSVEMKRRLEEILKALEKNDIPARALLEARALEVLENANTPEARKLLETLAGGTAEAELTTAAKAALARLAKKPRQP